MSGLALGVVLAVDVHKNANLLRNGDLRQGEEENSGHNQHEEAQSKEHRGLIAHTKEAQGTQWVAARVLRSASTHAFLIKFE